MNSLRILGNTQDLKISGRNPRLNGFRVKAPWISCFQYTLCTFNKYVYIYTVKDKYVESKKPYIYIHWHARKVFSVGPEQKRVAGVVEITTLVREH